MTGYTPLYIKGMKEGLVQDRVEFILPDDAYPQLENAFVWRERIKRKQGLNLLGRLERDGIDVSGLSLTADDINLISALSLETNAEIKPGSISITGGTDGTTYTDPAGNGTLVATGGTGTGGTINYATGLLTITAGATESITGTFDYYPGLPVMGLRSRELDSINNEQLIAFDTVYAYNYSAGWQEFIPGTTWTGNDSQFFWTTNYWQTPAPANARVFWVTNFSGTAGDPIRYTDGTAWIDFAPAIDGLGTPNRLEQCLALLPFRGRLLAFNTLEGTSLALSAPYPQRIRWSAIGTPISDTSSLFSTGTNPNAWRDDIRGQGGFLDIPTSQAITAVGFVRDNLVIYCERSTWQLRYTGRSISPFQIEKVNSELGAESTFSAVQFDTSLVGIGDKGVVECDSYKSERIDVKIPDLVYQFDHTANGTKRVYGIRDFQQRLAYWIYPYAPGSGTSNTYPNRRLVYNYENDSWAIFRDSLTALGNYQPITGLTWQQATDSWESYNIPWINRPAFSNAIVGGNQQGYVHFLGSNLIPQVSNDVSLHITAIQGNGATDQPTVITSPSHNLETDDIIQIQSIPTGTGYASLNGGVFQVTVGDLTGSNPEDKFYLEIYNPKSQAFDLPQVNASASYVGGGEIEVRDNFSIVSKKFNFLDQGQNIQMGYIDVLLNDTENGAISLNVYLDYNDNAPINTLPQNVIPATGQPNTFFNTTVPTSSIGGVPSSKNWQRVYCPSRGSFLTLEWTLSNAQMNGLEQTQDVQIQSQILWIRPGGRLQNQGF